MMHRLLTLPFALLLLAATVASAQVSSSLRIGGFGGVTYTIHSADFLRVPGTQSCCLGYTGGTGTGVEGGALAELPLASWLMLGARASVQTTPFSMSTLESTYLITESGGMGGTFEHRLNGSIATLGLEPAVIVRPVGSLLVSLGLRATMPISTDYEQSENIVEPSSSGTFLNPDGTDSHSRTRNAFSGELPGAGMRIAPSLMLSYELPMNPNSTLLLAPEISYQPGLTDVAEALDWKTSTLRAGVAVKFTTGGRGREEKIERRDVIDTVRVTVPVVAEGYRRGTESRSEKTERMGDADVTTVTVRRVDTLFIQQASTPALAASIRAVGVEADGREMPIVRMHVEEFSSTLMTPLLNYVFFEENSAELPARYSRVDPSDTGAFDIDRVNSPERLPTYHHLLNIVGRRLRNYPKATVTLTGCNQDIRDERGNSELSRRRAEEVRRYLIDRWGIESSRITVEARNLPAKAANTQTADGSQENRRVEIVSNDRRILAPVITRDTLRRADPPKVRFHTTATADRGVAGWNLNVDNTTEHLKSFDGAAPPPESIDWDLGREASTVPKGNGTMTYTLDVRDADGRTTSAHGSIPVEVTTIRQKRAEGRQDVEVDRFSLILFEVRSSDLTEQQQPVIELIRGSIRPSSTVSVIGYTDRLGDANYNQTLASGRSRTVAQALGTATPQVRGAGEADLFDSELPEGRLYTRTVDVVVETPIAP